MRKNMLHVVNKSTFQSAALQSCLRVAAPGSAILFVEDGVYSPLRGTAAGDTLTKRAKDLALYALSTDLAARGIALVSLIPGVECVDDDGFVALAVRYDSVHSWL